MHYLFGNYWKSAMKVPFRGIGAEPARLTDIAMKRLLKESNRAVIIYLVT